MGVLVDVLSELAEEQSFSGVVRTDRPDQEPLTAAFGWANRACRVPVAGGTRLAVASASKGFTAVVVMSLVQQGVLGLSTPVRDVLGSDLPLIDDRVTVEQLLAHRSGIGDYLD